MRSQQLTGRGLAKLVTDRKGSPISQSSLWIWLHNLNGYPHPKSFKESHLSSLAKALRVPQSELKATLDASRHLYTPTENPMPQEMFDSFARFIEILSHDRRQMLNRSYVLNLARTLHSGAQLEGADFSSRRPTSRRPL